MLEAIFQAWADHLIINGKAFAGTADTAEAARALEGLHEPRLHDVRQAVGPLRALQERNGVRSGADNDILAIKRFEGRWRGDQDLPAAMFSG